GQDPYMGQSQDSLDGGEVAGGPHKNLVDQVVRLGGAAQSQVAEQRTHQVAQQRVPGPLVAAPGGRQHQGEGVEGPVRLGVRATAAAPTVDGPPRRSHRAKLSRSWPAVGVLAPSPPTFTTW